MAVTSPIPLPPRDTRLLISACQPGLHAASRPATSTTTPPSQPPSHFLPRSRGRLLLHRPPLTRCSPHPLQSAALSMGLYDSFGNVKTKVNFLRIVGTALASAGFMTAALGMVVQAYGPDDVIAQFLNSKKPLFMVLFRPRASSSASPLPRSLRQRACAAERPRLDRWAATALCPVYAPAPPAFGGSARGANAREQSMTARASQFAGRLIGQAHRDDLFVRPTRA